jgi:hypothetical protein
MNNADRARDEFERIMRVTEERELLAKHLRGVEVFEELFHEAERFGIDRTIAWRIVERDPGDLKAGIMALIEEVRGRATHETGRTRESVVSGGLVRSHLDR